MEHTPGPWKIDGHQIIDSWQQGGHLITSVYQANDGKRGDWASNAKLIAASPALLAALEQIDTWLTTPDDLGPSAIVQFRALAREAIKLAKGN